MTRVRLIAVFIVGALIGAVTVELVHHSIDRHSKLMFARKLKCQSLAIAYARNNLTNGSVDSVDFSPNRNSCVALFSELHASPKPIMMTYSVRDLVSQKLVWATSCDLTQKCEDTKWLLKMKEDWDAAYQKAMAGRD